MKKILTVGLTLCAVGLFSGCQTTPNTPNAQVSVQTQQQIDQLLRLGNKTRESGDLRNALTFYQRAYSLDLQNKTSLFALAETTRKLGDISAAEGIYANGLANMPDDVDLLVRYGTILIEQDKLPQAMIQFQKTLQLNDQNERALSGLGVAYDLQGRHDLAQTQYKKALKLVPTDLKALNNYALSLALSEDFDKAIDLLSPYANDPTAPKRLRLNLAMIYGLKGDQVKAAQVAGQILDKETVENNLKAYEDLRQLSKEARSKAVMGK